MLSYLNFQWREEFNRNYHYNPFHRHDLNNYLWPFQFNQLSKDAFIISFNQLQIRLIILHHRPSKTGIVPSFDVYSHCCTEIRYIFRTKVFFSQFSQDTVYRHGRVVKRTIYICLYESCWCLTYKYKYTVWLRGALLQNNHHLFFGLPFILHPYTFIAITFLVTCVSSLLTSLT